MKEILMKHWLDLTSIVTVGPLASSAAVRIGRVVALLAVCMACVALQGRAFGQACNTRFCQFNFGDYAVQNDEWGLSADPSGKQEIQSSGNGWYADMSWAYTNGSVKAYPSIVAGWNFGPAWTPNHDGFPVQVKLNYPLPTSTSWHTTGTFINYDVAYDLFFSPDSDPAKPSGEMMVWIGESGNRPAGTQIASGVKLGGMAGTWDVWSGNVGWPVYSFVRTTSVKSFKGNLQPFVYYLAYTNKYLNPNWYILDMQFGSEILQANGKFFNTSFYGQASGSGVASVNVH